MRSLYLPLVAAGLTLGASLLLGAGEAGARVEADSEYSKAQTYNGALRYLRVDRGYEIVERDADAAYILFRYDTPGRQKRTTSGSIEVVEIEDRVRVFVQLPELPTYQESELRDGLLKKLRTEYGQAPRRKKPPPRKVDDAGAD